MHVSSTDCVHGYSYVASSRLRLKKASPAGGGWRGLWLIYSSFGKSETWELTGVIAVGGGVKGELTVKLVSFAPDFS